MRFTRVPPQGPDEIKEAVLADLDALSAGLRVVASAIPVPERGTIDLMAADDRGRLALISFALEAGHESVGLAVSQWEWATSSLGVLRALASGLGLDLSVEPRLLLVSASATEAARRLAGFIERPEIELYEATLVASGDHHGVLLEQVSAITLPPAGNAAGIDPVLDCLPAGEARSLMRRILEELRDTAVDGSPLDAAGLEGGVAIRRQGRLVGVVVAMESRVRTILIDEARVLDVEGDAGCRAAVSLLTKTARPEARKSPRTGVAGAGTSSPADGAGARGLTASLTPDEIAEFERISGPVEDRSSQTHPDETHQRSEGHGGHETRETGTGAQPQEPTGLQAMRSRFVEN
jgi:hypothetical protein